MQTPEQVIEDPALLSNDVIVPIEGGSDQLTRTVSSPVHLHGVEKVRARRAPELGEHNDEVLTELGFTREEVDALRASGAVPAPEPPARVAREGGDGDRYEQPAPVHEQRV